MRNSRSFWPACWIQSKDGAEWNNFRTALLLLEDELGRADVLRGMRAFFDERPRLLQRNRHNRWFYDHYLAQTAPPVQMEPEHWSMLAEMSDTLKV